MLSGSDQAFINILMQQRLTLHESIIINKMCLRSPSQIASSFWQVLVSSRLHCSIRLCCPGCMSGCLHCKQVSNIHVLRIWNPATWWIRTQVVTGSTHSSVTQLRAVVCNLCCSSKGVTFAWQAGFLSFVRLKLDKLFCMLQSSRHQVQ